jgi:hypothetical protein
MMEILKESFHFFNHMASGKWNSKATALLQQCVEGEKRKLDPFIYEALVHGDPGTLSFTHSTTLPWHFNRMNW